MKRSSIYPLSLIINQLRSAFFIFSFRLFRKDDTGQNTKSQYTQYDVVLGVLALGILASVIFPEKPEAENKES